MKTDSPAARDPRLDPFRDAVLELSSRGRVQGYLTCRVVPMRTFPVFWEWHEWLWYRVHWLDGHNERMREDHGPSWDVVSQLEQGRFVADDLAGRTFDARLVQGSERDVLWARYGPPA